MEERAHDDADPINPQRVFCELSQRLPDDAILDVRLRLRRQLVRARHPAPQRHDGVALAATLATMGPGVPYAIAAKFAHPDRPVIALVGDGAMQMNGMTELITVGQVLAPLARPAPDRARAEQPRPEPGHVGAAGDGGRPEVRGVAGPARLPLRRLRRADRTARASASTTRTQVGAAWDEALACRPAGRARRGHRSGGAAAAAAHHLRAGESLRARPSRQRRPGRAARMITQSLQAEGRSDSFLAAATSDAPPRTAACRSVERRGRRLHDPDRRAGVGRHARVGRDDDRASSRPARAATTGLGYTYARRRGRRRSSSDTRLRTSSTGARRAGASAATWRGDGPRLPQPRPARASPSMAIAAVDIALWDLKARLLGAAAGDRCSTRSAATRARLRQRRLHARIPTSGSPSSSAAGSSSGHPAREDEGRPRPRARPRARRRRARRDRPDAELFVDANGALSRKQALRWFAALRAPSADVTLVRGAGVLRRPRRAAAGARPGTRRAWRSRPASTATTLAVLRRDARRRRRRLPAGGRHPLRGHHRVPARRPRSARRASLELSAHCAPAIHVARLLRRSRRCATSSTSTTTSGSSGCSSTACSSPSTARSCPTSPRPGNGLELEARRRRATRARSAHVDRDRRRPSPNLRAGRVQKTAGRDHRAVGARRWRSRSTSSTTRRSFGDKWMWTPIVLTPPLTAAGVAGVFSERAAQHRAARRSRRSTAVDGLVGVVTHVQGVRSKPGGFCEATYNLVMGPPLLAPGSLLPGRRLRPARAADAPGALSSGARLPRGAASAEAARRRDPPTRASCRASAAGRRPQMHGRYPDYDVPRAAPAHWDELDARGSCSTGSSNVPPIALLHARRGGDARRVLRRRDSPRTREPRIPVLAFVDEKLAAGELDGYRYADMPDDRETWRLVAARPRRGRARARRSTRSRRAARAPARRSSTRFAAGELARRRLGRRSTSRTAWSVVMRDVLRGVLLAPVGLERDRLRRPGLPARLRAARRRHCSEPWEGAGGARRRSGRRRRATRRRVSTPITSSRARVAAGATTTRAFLLDPHRRGVPGRDRMRRYRDDDEVDLRDRRRRRRRQRARPAARAQRAGGSSCSRRGRSGIPTATGSPTRRARASLYWTEKRIDRRRRPGRARQEQLRPRRRRLDGRTTPATRRASTPPTSRRARATASAPTGRSPTSDLKPHYERVERELPVAGQDWPWGDPHGYPHAPHPISRRAPSARGRARAQHGIEMRVGPVAITNGVFGNRPHCIYRGFCLQGCKVNAKASPAVTHLPDAIEHGVEIRADCMAARIELDDDGRARAASPTSRDGASAFQRAAAVAVCGYSIETPRLLLNSTSAALPARARQRRTTRSAAT